MELAEAIKQLVPLQVLIPNRHRPLDIEAHYAAEVFLVNSPTGVAVVWIEPFWCNKPDEPVASIAYAAPLRVDERERWVDNDPRFGPKCIPYQKPFIMERLQRGSPAWQNYKAWQTWRGMKGKACGRRAAWQRIQAELQGIVAHRLH
jgi:hypothetical protein